MPATEFYCPVCGQDQEFIQVWQEQGVDKIRIFCEACSQKDEYRVLSTGRRSTLNREGFQKFAGSRLLSHVLSKEQAKATTGGATGDDIKGR